MRIRAALTGLLLIAAAAPASSEILYARPDAARGDEVYRWRDEVVRASLPLAAALEVAREANGSRPIEIRLLRQTGEPETVYGVELASLRSALRWRGSRPRG
jgi:hypothetical protein